MHVSVLLKLIQNHPSTAENITTEIQCRERRLEDKVRKENEHPVLWSIGTSAIHACP
jgi:hypothetical protein